MIPAAVDGGLEEVTKPCATWRVEEIHGTSMKPIIIVVIVVVIIIVLGTSKIRADTTTMRKRDSKLRSDHC